MKPECSIHVSFDKRGNAKVKINFNSLSRTMEENPKFKEELCSTEDSFEKVINDIRLKLMLWGTAAIDVSKLEVNSLVDYLE